MSLTVAGLDQFLNERLGPLLRHDLHHSPSRVPTLEACSHENANLMAAAQRPDIGIALMIWRLSA